MSEFKIKLKLKERKKKQDRILKGKKDKLAAAYEIRPTVFDLGLCYTALSVSNVVGYGSKGVRFQH